MAREIIQLGAVVKEKRQAKGLSLDKAAQKGGIAKATLLRLERNERDAQLTTLVGVAEALEITFIIGPDGVFIEDGQA